MAVGAQGFPVASVRRVVMVISIAMVDCQEVTIFLVKFTSAVATDQAVDGKSPFPILLSSGTLAAIFHLPDQVRDKTMVLSRFFACHRPGLTSFGAVGNHIVIAFCCFLVGKLAQRTGQGRPGSLLP